MTLDANGDPAFAFIFYDPNLDTDPSDTRLEFRSWNRAQYKWYDVVHAATNLGDVASHFHAALSLACDTVTNTFAIASELAPADQSSAIALYVSADGGATWTRKTTFTYSGEAATAPSLP